jgi:hypothetical protein
MSRPGLLGDRIADSPSIFLKLNIPFLTQPLEEPPEKSVNLFQGGFFFTKQC